MRERERERVMAAESRGEGENRGGNKATLRQPRRAAGKMKCR